MRIDLEHLPSDPALLHALVRDMASQLTDRNEEIERLKHIIHQFQRAHFGRRSEQLSDDQLALGLDDLESDLGEAVARRARSAVGIVAPASEPPRRKPLPEHLPRVEHCLTLDARVCECCGGALHEIGESVSEMLDWIPARVQVLQIRRPKFGCRQCEKIYQAEAPARPIAGGLPTVAMLAQVAIAKYADHTPLYRQAQIFARHGIELERSTLAGWIGGTCVWLEPLYHLLCADILRSTHLFADDTPVPVLDPGRGRTKTGRLWAYARDDRRWCGPEPPAAVYIYSPNRKGQHPAEHLEHFEGVLQVDAYSGYRRIGERATVVLAACWAHARRKLYEIAEATGSPIALEALQRVDALYRIEEDIRGQSADARLRARQLESVPLLAELHIWFEQQLTRVPRRSPLASAIRYALARWNALCVFTTDGRVELDTNVVERAIRPVALGRKNHLFAGSDRGAERWAMLCSLIETCKLNGVEPYAYLRDVLERLVAGHPANRLAELLPWAWTSSATSVH